MGEQTPLGLAVTAIVATCVVVLFAAIARNFLRAPGPGAVREQKRSVVETGSMTAFFVGYFLLIRAGVGLVEVPWWSVRLGMIGVGLVLIVGGTGVNLLGRRHLGANWANQVILYDRQTLVTDGVYGLVRHPLYASLIWMFFGGALVYANAAALAANVLVFVPFMTWRAWQEEKLLAQAFPGHGAYRARVGLFFPRLLRGGC